MEKDYLKFIKQFLGESAEMKPVPTLLKPLLRADSSIRAVVFDVYGTILISASGDIDESEISTENLKISLDSAGIAINDHVNEPQALLVEILESFKKAVKNFHQSLRTEDMPYPEIDILEIWESIIEENSKNNKLILSGPLCIKCFTFVFEVLSNHIYPMPGLKGVINRLHEKKLPLGIISNAQFYTPVILNYFMHNEVAETEQITPFDPDLTIFSYQHQRSKPDTYLFELLKEKCLQKYGIFADEILFIGNDMFRDVYPACLSGFKTALFAGDAKSLRLRQDRPELKTITPDYIITDLNQLLEIIT
jgi:putative hydrolase of the HAD superfamily